MMMVVASRLPIVRRDATRVATRCRADLTRGVELQAGRDAATPFTTQGIDDVELS
jgi:hypothetical protein